MTHGAMERSVVFTQRSNVDSWDVAPVMTGGATAIVAFGGDTGRPDGGTATTTHPDGVATVHMREEQFANVAWVRCGDTFTVDGMLYGVTMVDARGVLPTRYKYKIVGVSQ